jgi:hypothetical protein
MSVPIVSSVSNNAVNTTEIAAPVESIQPSRESLTGFTQNAMFITTEGPVSISQESNLGKVFQVWNGQEFVPGTPKKSTMTNDLIRVVTTDGNMIDCMPDQEFLLADGVTKKRADKLALDDELARSLMPSYTGDTSKENLEAFLLGAIYGACLAGAPGSGKIDDILDFQMPFFTLDQKLYKQNAETGKMDEITNPHLKTFNYDYKKAVDFARQNNLGAFDHETYALIIVPDGYQKAITIPNAPLKDRNMWCAGFLMMTARGTSVNAARGNLDAAMVMINSISHKHEVKAEPTDSEGRWSMKPLYMKEDDPKRATLYPKVWSVARVKTKRIIPIYTIDGVANGQVMINRLLVPITKNKPVDENAPKVIYESNGKVVAFD